MSEIDQLKKRIDESGLFGLETAQIRDDYEPAGQMMIGAMSGALQRVRLDRVVRRR